MYQYIPLANTTDKNGKEAYDNVHVAAHDAKISRFQEDGRIPATVINQIPRLFYPHTQAVSEASENLNKSFLPATGVNPKSIGEHTEDTVTQCQILDVRTNSGDDLTFDNTQPKSRLDFLVSYRVDEILCKYKGMTQPKIDPITGIQTPPQPIYDCSSDVTAEINLTTLAPNLNEIWKNTVAGEGSTFRRIYPKIEADAPVSCIADIPGESDATYVINDALSDDEVTNLKVRNPGNSNDATPQIYFPHLGSVYEYFLKGIQTAIRPKGFGDPVSSGKLCTDERSCGSLPNLPVATGACSLGSISQSIGTIPQSLKDIINAAADTYKVPPNLILGVMYGEGLFNPGRFQWTDTNVKNWATCTKIPGCQENGTDYFMGFNGNVFKNIVPHIRADIQKADPTRTTFSQCNLMDSIYAVAWNLHDSADGGMPFSCFGIDLNAPVPNSCIWSPNQYESAIKVSESGYTNMCLTRVDSCLTGGGTAAACPGGDNCETINHREPRRSHNGCVWDVAHGQ